MIKGPLTTIFGVRLKKVSMMIYDDIMDFIWVLKLVVSPTKCKYHVNKMPAIFDLYHNSKG
jgi:hypothetical protein